MSFKTRIAALALATLVVTGGVAATSNQAQAGHHGLGIGLGFAAGALLGATATGAYAYGYGPSYVSYRRCRWVNQYDGYGYFVGRSRVCGYPAY